MSPEPHLSSEPHLSPESQILLLLLAGIYGTLTIVMKMFEMINERRDVLLGIKERQAPLAREHKVLLWNDWVLLWIGCLLFLGLTATFFWLLPSLATTTTTQESLLTFVEYICYICSFIAAYGLLAQIVGGMGDIRAMRRAISETQPDEKESVNSGR
jgi:hypothetical protein